MFSHDRALNKCCINQINEIHMRIWRNKWVYDVQMSFDVQMSYDVTTECMTYKWVMMYKWVYDVPMSVWRPNECMTYKWVWSTSEFMTYTWVYDVQMSYECFKGGRIGHDSQWCKSYNNKMFYLHNIWIIKNKIVTHVM